MSAYSSSEGMKVLLQKGALIKCDGMVTENGVVTMPSRLTVKISSRMFFCFLLFTFVS